jgi:hypothetical protein
MNQLDFFQQIELPTRWEILQQRAEKKGVAVSQFIEKVDSAAARIDELLYKVNRPSAGGCFEIFYGLAGAGKTTFLNTIPIFFDGVHVHHFTKEQDLQDINDFILKTWVPNDINTRIFVITGRDNPKTSELENIYEAIEDLRETFRDPSGKVLVVWPVTKLSSAKKIANAAWEIGRGSVVDTETQGFYQFEGVSKSRFFTLADRTSRNLTGDGLEAYGITEDDARSIVSKSETIGDFFDRLSTFADEKLETVRSQLKKRVRVRLWILLPGDHPEALVNTVSALTQGTMGRVDLDKILEFVDHPDTKANYIVEWKRRRGTIGFLLRELDVRLFPVHPNVALAAVRSFGEGSVKEQLSNQKASLGTSKKTLRASRFYKEILSVLGIPVTISSGSRTVKQDTMKEYRRVQKLAKSDDKPLNKALGALIAECLNEDVPSVQIVTEKRKIEKSSLQPDIAVELNKNEFICLEPTWRSTGQGIHGELNARQNTLAEAHVKMYILNKLLEYVKDAGL